MRCYLLTIEMIVYFTVITTYLHCAHTRRYFLLLHSVPKLFNFIDSIVTVLLFKRKCSQKQNRSDYSRYLGIFLICDIIYLILHFNSQPYLLDIDVLEYVNEGSSLIGDVESFISYGIYLKQYSNTNEISYSHSNEYSVVNFFFFHTYVPLSSVV